MGAISVAVYAEGTAELAGASPRFGLIPGDTIPEDSLGAAHVLIRRILETSRDGGHQDVRFICPKFPSRRPGRFASGSDLYTPTIVRQLVTWFPTRPSPSLCVVLFDTDGEKNREPAVRKAVDGISMPTVVGVCRKEFETWLAADVPSARATLGVEIKKSEPRPENLPRGRAKEMVVRWIKEAALPPVQACRSLAGELDIERVQKACPKFGTFVRDLRRAADTAGATG